MLVPGVAHRMMQAGAVKLRCAELGDPKAPLVLFLHGFPESWASWRRQLPAFAEAGFFAVAPELRGYGGSDKPSGVRNYRVEELARDIASLIEAYGREQAIVIGHDWGAYVAWHLAMWHPAHVSRLAILNVPHPRRMMRALLTPRQLRKSWYIVFFQLPFLPERALRANGFAAFQKLFRHMGVRPGAFDEEAIAENVAALSAPGALTAALNYYRAGRIPPPPLQIIRCPVLVIWGEQDRWLGSELAEPDARWVPEARVERIAEAGHFVHADAPERVTKLLLELAQ